MKGLVSVLVTGLVIALHVGEGYVAAWLADSNSNQNETAKESADKQDSRPKHCR